MKDIKNLFEIMNRTNYLVLRNYDDIICGWETKTDDIDVLCENRDEFVAAVGAVLCRTSGICHNYYVPIGEKKIRMDIRSIGDGYYDAVWERDMLAHRVWHDGFFVMAQEDYINSIAYHALIQKKSFSDKYFNIIKGEYGVKSKSAMKCGIKMTRFMKEHGYHFVLPQDPFVTLNKKHYRFFAFLYKIV